MSELSFEQMLEDSFKTIRNGDVVEGTVIGVKPEEIILNIGYKADGVLTKSEYSNDSGIDLTTVVSVGDKMEVKGMMGRKKINDIFIDDKIPAHERDMWPVVVDSLGKIVWLPGLKKSKFNSKKDEKCDIILRYY